MTDNPLRKLESLGQALWLDYIRRDLISGGGLKRLIEEDGLRGMTSNPAIFEKAIAESHEYDAEIKSLARDGRDAFAVYDALSRKDVQSAADAFAPVYERTGAKDGYVSLEVNPHLARNAQGTVEEARRLWKALDRPNVHIKVPATKEGLPAIRTLISEGINVNVTLLFGLSRYREVVEAYWSGLEALAARGKPLARVSSVASFFVSRIDTAVDPLLEKAPAHRGQVAIACARMAYQAHKALYAGERFRKLAAQGAQVQRLLWASTGTKNPAESDVKYVEALIGPDTVNTAPVETVNAYRDHGKPEARLEKDLDQARALLAALPGLGVDLERTAQKLEDEGVEKFNQPFDKLLAAVAERSKA